MRIIKLSPRDQDFPNRDAVDKYFAVTLPNRNPVGQFLLTMGRIAEGGIETGEPIIFSYETEITHIAKAASGRFQNKQANSRDYPFYFLVNRATDCRAQGKLNDVEASFAAAGVQKNIVRTQGWPRILDTPAVQKIWNDLKR